MTKAFPNHEVRFEPSTGRKLSLLRALSLALLSGPPFFAADGISLFEIPAALPFDVRY
jgi:hypothetical protein